jgi:23S rRNA pseudouridine1911/1915/1917 synthase
MRLFPKDRDLSTPPERVELEVRASDLRLPVEDVEIRLDLFLCHFLSWRSRASVQALIREGRVLVDASTPDHPRGRGEPAVERRSGRKLRHGSRVIVEIPEPLRLPRESQSSELAILYEDESALAVDKPPMLAVHPGGRHLSGTLIQRVHAHYGLRGSPREGRPRLCHRIDRETSGVVLIGKDPRAHSALMGQFERREVEKEYLAIVRGVPSEEGGTIDLPLAPARASRIGLKMAVALDGSPSRTDWSVVSRHRDCALIACRPTTGRQHQIRVHMDAIGHPLVGDKLYGVDERLFQRHLDGPLSADDLRTLELPRHALHSHRLAFLSPRSRQRIEVVSPLAPDLATWLRQR